MRRAQLGIIDEAVRRAIKTLAIDPRKQYLLAINTGVMAPDLIATFAMGLDRAKIGNVLIWALKPGSLEAIKLFEQR